MADEEYILSKVSDSDDDEGYNIEEVFSDEISDDEENISNEEIQQKICYTIDLLEQYIHNQTNKPSFFTILPWEPLQNEYDLKEFLSSPKHLETFDRKVKMSKNFILKCLDNYILLGININDVKIIKKHYFANIGVDSGISSFDEEDHNNNDNELLKIKSSILDDNLIKQQDNNTIISSTENDFQEKKLENIDEFENNEKFIPEIAPIAENNITIHKSENKQNITFDSIYKTSTLETNINDLHHIKLNKNQQYLAETTKIQIENLLFQKDSVSLIDKQLKIIRFFKEYNINIQAEIFDTLDNNGDKIITEDNVTEWYKKINLLEIRKNKIFNPSTLAVVTFLWIIELAANKLNIIELKDLSKNIDIHDLPTELDNVREYIDEKVFDKIPKSPIIDIIYYITGVYIKNKTGLNMLK